MDEPRTPAIPRRGLAIAAVSEMLMIPIPTIRSWERRYGFPTPTRTPGKHRRYSITEVEQLRALRDQITRGHSASDAVAIVRGRLPEGQERSRHLEGFLDAAMRFDTNDLRDELDASGRDLGIDAAITSVVLPAMHEVGTRWRAGACEVGNEHIATDGVRTWLSRVSSVAPPPWRGPLVLACGPKDLHTIGLEAFATVLVRRGWSVRNLGAMTPIASLVNAIRASGARGAVIVAQRNVTRRATVESIAAADAQPGARAFYAGAAFDVPANRRGVPGVYLGNDVLAAADVIEAELETRTSTRGAG
jgi:DNA-binding transcriptional MerR regulator